jgi:Tol biopolymer transport system component
MPDFDTRKPPEANEQPNGLRDASMANKTRTLLMANKPRIRSIASGLRGLSTARRLRAFMIGGGILLFVVAVGVGLLEAPNDRIAFVSDPENNAGDGIYVMDSDGTNRTRITDATGYSGLAWSPDGERLAFSTGDGVGGDAHIYVMNADGTGKTRISSNPGSKFEVYVGAPVWSPDGEKVAFGRSVQKVTRSASAAAAGSAEPSPSPVAEKSGIYVVDADGTNESNLIHSGGFGAWSPDGKKIAYMGNHPGGLTSDIFVMNANGSGRRRLTKRLRNFFPVWSPDGKKIAFLAEDIHGTVEIDVMNADGTGRKELASGSIAEHSPAWSLDGQKIAFMKRAGNFISADGGDDIWVVTSDVYVMDADGTGKTRITNTKSKDESIVAWSPEGDKILVVANDPPSNPNDSEICLIDVDGSGRRCLVDLAEGEIVSGGDSPSVAWATGR